MLVFLNQPIPSVTTVPLKALNLRNPLKFILTKHVHLETFEYNLLEIRESKISRKN